MRLKSALKRRSVAELAKMATAWGLEDELPAAGSGREAFVAHLYPRLQSSGHFQHLWDSLAEGSQRLAIFLAIHGGDLGLRELARRCFGGDARAARKSLVALVECGLAFRDSLTSAEVNDEVYGIPDLLLRHVELYAHYRGYLGQFLHDRSAEELERILVEGFGQKVKSNKRDFLRHVVRRALLRPSTLRTHVQGLQPGEKELFHNLLRRGGVCIYGDLIDLGHQRHADHAKVEMLNRLLRNSGLIHVAAKGENKYADLLQVPKDIAHVVRHGYREDNRSLSQLDTATAGGRHQPNAVSDNGAQILRDLVIFIAHVQRDGVRRLANGAIAKNDLKRILPMLSPGKTLKYARFLGLAAIEHGLVETVGDRWQASDRLLTWTETPAKAYGELVHSWYHTPSWNEEYAEGDVLHADTPVTNMINIPEVRRLVVESLLELPHGQWVEFRAFANVLLPKIAIAVPRRAQVSTGKHNRPPFYIAESVVADSLHWLGIVILGSDHSEHLEAVQSRGNLPVGGPRRRLRKRLTSVEDTHLLFRITPLGDSTLQHLANGRGGRLDGNSSHSAGNGAPLTFDATQFTVQPNHEVLTPPDLSLPVLARLLAFCEVRSVDVMATLAITAESVRRGMEQGFDAATILETLREGSSTPLPQTVEHLVDECARKSVGLLITASGGALAVDDPVIMAEIRASKRLQSLIREIIEDRVVLFHPHAPLERVAREIEKLGHTVSVDGEAAVPNSAGRVSISLSERDLMAVIAALSFTADLERDLGIDLSEGRMRTVAHRLEPGGPRQETLLKYAETLASKFRRRHDLAVRRRIEQATERHRAQVAKLMDTAVRRPRGRHQFEGANPATENEDVRSLMDFAIENELPVQIRHRSSSNKLILEKLKPESLEGERVYAFSGSRETHSLLRLDRIVEARLL
jgi:hypothetical protein